jgi:hypothetical protein
MYRSPNIRIRVYMEQALERACRSLPHGGDHDLRAFIATRLSEATSGRMTTLGELGIVARKALADYQSVAGRSREPQQSLA